MHPQYHVTWIQAKTCKACGFETTEQSTYAFFKPEAAMEQAVWVLKHGHTLISVEL